MDAFSSILGVLPSAYHFPDKLFPLYRTLLIIQNTQRLKSSSPYLFAFNNNWLII